MTKAEAALPMRMYISLKEHKANQKREKQRRYRHNKATRETQLRLKERRTMKIQGSTVFYVPARRKTTITQGNKTQRI